MHITEKLCSVDINTDGSCIVAGLKEFLAFRKSAELILKLICEKANLLDDDTKSLFEEEYENLIDKYDNVPYWIDMRVFKKYFGVFPKKDILNELSEYYNKFSHDKIPHSYIGAMLKQGDVYAIREIMKFEKTGKGFRGFEIKHPELKKRFDLKYRKIKLKNLSKM
jgi:hypothetical protein